MRKGTQHKLSSKFSGPFQIIQKLGKVAYKLELPVTALCFTLSQLKLCRGVPSSAGVLPELNDEGLLMVQPVAVVDRKMAKRGNVGAVYLLVQWADVMARDFPNLIFTLEVKGIHKRDGML